MILDVSIQNHRDLMSAFTEVHLDIFIRAAREADVPALVRLNGIVQRYHAELDASFFKAVMDEAELADYFSERLEADRNTFLLAETNDDKAVGYIWFERQERGETVFTLPLRRIYVHHIAIDETMRRQGLASMLMKKAEDEARSLDIEQVALDTWAANALGQQFFTSQGFHPYHMCLRKSVV